jgi:hypothetical protein
MRRAIRIIMTALQVKTPCQSPSGWQCHWPGHHDPAPSVPGHQQLSTQAGVLAAASVNLNGRGSSLSRYRDVKSPLAFKQCRPAGGYLNSCVSLSAQPRGGPGPGRRAAPAAGFRSIPTGPPARGQAAEPRPGCWCHGHESRRTNEIVPLKSSMAALRVCPQRRRADQSQ